METINQEFQSKYSNFLVHYYRAEVTRETAWRNRLDVTTNWAIVITAALLTFVFGTSGISHVVLIINYFIIWFFLYIEARRFRYYALVKDRVKIFEKRILGPLMGMKDDEKTEIWLAELSEKLINPKVKMSRLESLSWRIRRNYIFIFSVIFTVWIYKVSVFPLPAQNAYDFFENAKLGFIPGTLVFFGMVATLLTAIILAFYVSRKWGSNDLP